MNARAAIADRRVLPVAGGAVAIVLLIGALALGGGSRGPAPPPDDAARLVPADVLVFVHVSTDLKRTATKQALDLARRFPGFTRLRDSLLSRLQAPGCGTDVRRLKGKEAALALLDSSTGTAGSLVLVDTGEEHKSADTRSCGAVARTFIGRFLIIGQQESLIAAQRLADKGDLGDSLARDDDYAKATSGLPAGRVADAWASRAGVRRLLEPQGGLLGAAGALLDQPGLKGAAVGLEGHGRSARLVVRSELRGGGRPPRLFTPMLQAQAPAGALAYLSARGLATALNRLIAVTGSGAAGLGRLQALAGRPLEGQPAGRPDRLPHDAFAGEVGLTLSSASPAPVLTITAHAGKGATAMPASLRQPIIRLLGPNAAFRELTVDGHHANAAQAGGRELAYAVFGGRLVISTATSGLAAAARGGARLDRDAVFRSVMGDAPKQVSSLLFLDFTQLLRLGEQTGLGGSRAYRSVRDDLKLVRAVGAWSSTTGDESTAEINLSIP